MGVHLERLQECDWQRLNSLMVATRGPEGGIYDEKHGRRILKQTYREVWVATDGSVDIGIVRSTIVKEGEETTIVVNTLFVKKSHRGGGVGSDLLRRVEEWAVEKKILIIKTSVDLKIENPDKVVAWLGSKGFEEISSGTNFIGLRKQTVEEGSG